MRLRDALDGLGTDTWAGRVFSEPVETADGATIIPVARVRARSSGLGPNPDGPPGQNLRVSATPVGVFVVQHGKVHWAPAVDSTRIALLAETIGLVAATLGTLAVVRRPPWPDLSRRVLDALARKMN